MKRSLTDAIQKDLARQKLMLLSGPRQVGKSTLSRSIVESFQYLNFDDEKDRKTISTQAWDRQKQLIIFDELHKKPKWKSWLKGIYDTESKAPNLMVTGSARMDVFRKGGDSLAGRHFTYRLHPFTVAELKDQMQPMEILDRLMKHGGFPEPFLTNDSEFSKRWRRSHIDQILREDLLDLEQVRQLKAMELLVDLLAERVGSTISMNSLARDLQVSPHTVKRWIEILEALFVIFVVYPYSNNIARSILKEPKIYFFDIGRIKDDPAARFENVIALALLQSLQMREDLRGEKNGLYYLRDQQKHEVDFLVLSDRRVEQLIEVKTTDSNFSKNLVYFSEKLRPEKSLQVVLNADKEKSTASGLQLIPALKFLQNL